MAVTVLSAVAYDGDPVLGSTELGIDNATGAVKVGDGTSLFSALAALSGTSVAPIQTRRTAGDIALPSSSTAWFEVDTGGSAAARPLDIVIPGVVAGQWVTLSLSAVSSGASYIFLDLITIVAGAIVHGSGGNAASGVGAWLGSANVVEHHGGVISYRLLASDIENGAARFRLFYVTNGARTLYASGGTYSLIIEGRGPLG